jgi:predicted transposase/invertase (TIGR01784 family)
MDYSSLPHSYIIFICDFDYYGLGAARYNHIVVLDDEDNFRVDNRAHFLILNSRYQRANVRPAIKDFLDYIRLKDDHYPYTSDLVKKAVGEMERLRADKDVGGAYMTWAMSMQDERSIGREEGRAEGIQIGEARGVISTLINLVMERMLPYEVGREKSGLSEEEFRAKIAEIDPNFQR